MSLAPPSSGGSMARYQRVKVLGQGSYGRAILVKETAGQRLFVIKEVDLSRGSQRDEALREVQFMSVLCQHPYIVELKEWFEDRPAKKLYIVMRYCDGGDLSSKVQKRRGVLLPESQVLHLFIQICLGLKHIHDRKILYRDLKSQNIFLHGKEPAEVVNLGDFGIAKGLDNTLANCKTQIGTPYYLSPEICAGKSYSFATDMWSLGILLYELLTLQMPFNGDSMPSLFLNIIKAQPKSVSSMYSADIRSLCDELLHKDPNKRPTIATVLQRPILAKLIDKYLTAQQRADEFAHTVLHGVNQREMVKLAQVKKQAAAVAAPVSAPAVPATPTPPVSTPANPALPRVPAAVRPSSAGGAKLAGMRAAEAAAAEAAAAMAPGDQNAKLRAAIQQRLLLKAGINAPNVPSMAPPQPKPLAPAAAAYVANAPRPSSAAPNRDKEIADRLAQQQREQREYELKQQQQQREREQEQRLQQHQRERELEQKQLQALREQQLAMKEQQAAQAAQAAQLKAQQQLAMQQAQLRQKAEQAAIEARERAEKAERERDRAAKALQAQKAAREARDLRAKEALAAAMAAGREKVAASEARARELQAQIARENQSQPSSAPARPSSQLNQRPETPPQVPVQSHVVPTGQRFSRQAVADARANELIEHQRRQNQQLQEQQQQQQRAQQQQIQQVQAPPVQPRPTTGMSAAERKAAEEELYLQQLADARRQAFADRQAAKARAAMLNDNPDHISEAPPCSVLPSSASSPPPPSTPSTDASCGVESVRMSLAERKMAEAKKREAELAEARRQHLEDVRAARALQAARAAEQAAGSSNLPSESIPVVVPSAPAPKAATPATDFVSEPGVQFFFKARPQPQVDVEDSARVRVADIQPVVSVSPWLRPSEPSPPSRRYANIIQSVDHSSSDNETAEDDQEEQLASDAFDQATCEFDAAVDAYIATFRQSSLTISSEDFESVSENISADAAQNAELDLAADVREAMKTWAKFEQISQDVDIDTTSGDAQSDADVLVFADDGCDHLEELVRLSGAGSEAASPPSQPADSLTSPSSLAEAAAMIAQNQMLLAEQSDNMWNVTGAPEAKPSAVSDPVVYHQEANDVWQQQVIQLLMAQHAAHVSPTNASSSPVTAFNSAPQVPPSIKVGTPPTAEFGSGPEPYSVHQVMKRPSGVFDPVKATPTVAPTPSTAAPTPTTSSGKSTPASAQSAAQRAESLKLYLERALGLDVMVDAYTSLHRALETQDVKPEVAVAGIIPPHKLKYVPLLVELIEKEKQC